MEAKITHAFSSFSVAKSPIATYELLNKDSVICTFKLLEKEQIGYEEPIEAVLQDVYESALLTEILQTSDFEKVFDDFVNSRRMCKGRQGMEKLMEIWNMKRLDTYLDISHGLSFIDTVWTRRAGEKTSWNDVDLYTHDFNEVIAHQAFTGQGLHGNHIKTTSPEFGTNGALPKCWHKSNGVIKLYKGGILDWKGPIEPLMEYYACQVAKIMGITYIDYQVEMFRGHLVSVCDIFTSEKYGYRQISDYLTNYGNAVVRTQQLYAQMNQLDALFDMLLFDSIIGNVDRHYGNFGFYIDNTTYKPIAAAPIFDNGMSLGGRVAAGANPTEEFIRAVNDHGSSCFGLFIPGARKTLSKRRADMIRPLLQFEFVEHPKYKLKYPSLQNMNALVQHQVREILKRSDNE